MWFRVAFLPVTFIYVVFGLAITSIAIEIGAEYMKKLHYIGQKVKNVAKTKIRFGSKTLTVIQLLYAVGKKCGIDPKVIDNLDLEHVVESTIAVNEGREIPEDVDESFHPQEPQHRRLSSAAKMASNTLKSFEISDPVLEKLSDQNGCLLRHLIIDEETPTDTNERNSEESETEPTHVQAPTDRQTEPLPDFMFYSAPVPLNARTLSLPSSPVHSRRPSIILQSPVTFLPSPTLSLKIAELIEMRDDVSMCSIDLIDKAINAPRRQSQYSTFAETFIEPLHDPVELKNSLPIVLTGALPNAASCFKRNILALEKMKGRSQSMATRDKPKRFEEKKEIYGKNSLKLFETYREEWDRIERREKMRREKKREKSRSPTSPGPSLPRS
ncbi:hypothetical protein L596_021044 [Steinernema carpocapsae]|uniref:Uncharacterized protein n=1 Tax=Steinernema carpocapsae TaxID=34508 RepID=A0A4U5MVZ1_STECR|nr:hypothetical protein L596_021044 [Steinernema carpocapsae]